jgi:DNA-binding response OmpR family regulator
LVVEMDPFFAILVREALQASGIACRVAYSARAAAILLRSEVFQIVFAGARLPDDTGLNMVPAIRASQGREIPIVVVGTDDAVEFRREVLASGANEYLLKPVSLAELRDVIQMWVPTA